MNRYPNYTATNLPWLSEVPAHWGIARAKNFFTESIDRVESKWQEFALLSLTKNGIIPRDVSSGKGKFPKDFDTYKIVCPGDMAFCLFDIDETPRTVGLSSYHGMLTGAYNIFHVHGINPGFTNYYFLSIDNVKGLRPFYTGLRKTVDTARFLNVSVPIPPRSEQDQIVRYLDWQTSRINGLIAAKRREIELLRECEQHLIDKIVMCGLQESQLTQSNDARWDITYPVGWKIKRIKELFEFRKGLSITKANLQETGIAVINYGQIHSPKNSGAGLNQDLIRYVDESYLQNNKSSLVSKGDFIFADTSEDIAGCGNCVYIDWDATIFAGSHSIIAHALTSDNNQYLAYLFLSDTWRQQIRENVNGIKVYSITQTILKDTLILVPPIDEQREIVAYIKEKSAKIDSTVAGIERQISLLHELRTRLISDVVTGQIDVRGVTVPEFESIAEPPADDAEEESAEYETEE